MIVLVMPAYNEEDAISEVVKEWRAALQRLGYPFSMLVIDDGSRDGTAAVLARLAESSEGQVRVIRQPNNGHGRACRRGYEMAVAAGAGWVLQVDSDGQCDPAYLEAFWNAAREADCVFGVRTRRDDGPARAMISRLCSRLGGWAAGCRLSDANVPYRLIRAAALQNALRRVPEDIDMQNVAITVALRRVAGLRWAEVPIHFRQRRAGDNSIRLPQIARMGWRMLHDLRRVSR